MLLYIRFFSVLLLALPALSLQTVAEQRLLIPFQVYLWPGSPNPNQEAAMRNRPADADPSSMMEYVPPTIQFSPDGETSVQSVSAGEHQLSPVYQYAGDNPIVFFREESASEGEVRRIPLGDVSVPADIERALLLFMPDPGKTETYLIHPIDSSLAKTAPGHASVYNLSGSAVACLFNGKQFLLEPGESVVVPLGAEQCVNVVVRIGAEVGNGQWRERYAQQLTVRPRDSLNVLIYRKPGRRDNFGIIKIENPENPPVAGMEPGRQSASGK